VAITLRSDKGSPLTHNELDGNFTDLDGRVALLAPKASPTLTGDIEFDGVSFCNVETGSSTLDCSTGNVFTLSMSGNITLAVDNVPAGAYMALVQLTYTSGALTLDTGMAWAGGNAPTLSAGVWFLNLVTIDQGTNVLVSAVKRGA